MSDSTPRAPRRSRQFWIDHVEQWKNSGLSKAVYCQQHSLNTGSFYNWSRPARMISNAQDNANKPHNVTALPDCSPLNLIPVTVKPDERRAGTRFVHVERAATDIALPADLSAEQIHQWLSAIHQLRV